MSGSNERFESEGQTQQPYFVNALQFNRIMQRRKSRRIVQERLEKLRITESTSTTVHLNALMILGEEERTRLEERKGLMFN